jgi:hypothetical protein
MHVRTMNVLMKLMCVCICLCLWQLHCVFHTETHINKILVLYQYKLSFKPKKNAQVRHASSLISACSCCFVRSLPGSCTVPHANNVPGSTPLRRDLVCWRYTISEHVFFLPLCTRGMCMCVSVCIYTYRNTILYYISYYVCVCMSLLTSLQ